jgi:hypothetical protein
MQAVDGRDECADAGPQYQHAFSNHVGNDLIGGGPTDAESPRNLPFRWKLFIRAVNSSGDLRAANFRQLEMDPFGYDLWRVG